MMYHKNETIYFIDESFSIPLPCASRDADGKVPDGQSIEPISVAFALAFGIILIFQFVFMVFHRLTTLIQMCASTEIFKKKKPVVCFVKCFKELLYILVVCK